ncbi:MurR/RpiR family transcriptional regulator [Acholeplasma granularum]|uniref:MurR/RpiR family transcriptional regulator n=1 Tax=Acholeplasma granularum TaxID=264635 RepID=UPI00046FAED8|nr:MurR/RpiR family transcriptional regulator [Acholeplasma granularum]
MDERRNALFKRYQPYIDKLSKTELIIHNYVVGNPEQVIYSAISQLSNLLEVGEATILRYVKKMGFDGYASFKLELFKEFDATKEITNKPYIEQIASNMETTIQETKARINEKEIDKAAHLILNSKKVLVIGQGASHISAQDTFSRLIRIGIDAVVVHDTHLLYMYTSILNPDTVVISYTFSGETKEIVKASELAKKSGCKVIGITNYEKSAISNLSDVTLYTSGYEQNLQGGVLSSKISQLFISDVLITRCSLLNEEKSLENIRKTTQSLFD